MLQLVQSLRTGQPEVIDVPVPAPRGNEVLVRTGWSVISPGTEQAVARTAGRTLVGKALERPDQVRKVVEKVRRDGVAATATTVNARLDDFVTPGYSSSGRIESVGPDVVGLAPGDRVGCVGANMACHAEFAVVPAPMCILLPSQLDERWGAFGALGAIAGHGVRVAEVTAGSTVVVIGLGLIGQIAAQLVTAAGGRVVAVDTDANRVDLACKLGAAAGAVLPRDDAVNVVLAISDGHGADGVVVSAASSSSAPLELAAALARDRAVVSVIGDVGLQLSRRAFFEKELALRVSRSYGPGRYDPTYEQAGHDYPIGYVRWTQRRLIGYFFDELAAGRVTVEPLVTHEFTISRGEEAYTAMDAPGRMAILLRYDATRSVSAPAKSPRVSPATRAPATRGLRIGLVGPGLFARTTLLPILQEIGAELVVTAGGGGPRAVSTARKYGIARVATNVTEVIEDHDVDVVVISTRHDSHAHLAAACLEHGKAVFLEKPLAIDMSGVERLRPLLNAGARLVVDFNRRFAPATRKAIALLRQRTDPLHIHYRVNAGALTADHWLRDPQVGGGRVVGEACHFVDFCTAVIASPVVRLQVAGLGRGPRTLEDDSFVLTLWHADGSVSVISYIATGHARMPKERIEIIGSGESIVIDDFRRLRRFGQRPGLPRNGIGQDKGHKAALVAALEFFGGSGAPPIAVQELLATTEICLAARSALREGSVAPIDFDSAR